MSEKIGLLPTCWGPSAWKFLESIAYVYNPDTDDRQKYFDFFAGLGYILPCEECRKNYIKHFDTNSLVKALETNDGIFRWVYDLHNKVNKNKNIPESSWPSYEQVKNKYNAYKANCDSVNSVCSLPKNARYNISTIGYGPDDKTIIIICSVIAVIVIILFAWYFKYYRKNNFKKIPA